MSTTEIGHQSRTTIEKGGFKVAVLAMGCFWSPDSLYGATKGVIRTKVGYSGGTTENPTYKNIGDHTEVIQVDYDPNLITYEDILALFWSHHDPTHQTKNQYRSMILYANEEDKAVAEKSLAEQNAKRKQCVTTIIAPLQRFYDAEDYHQKYRLRSHSGLVNNLQFDSQSCFKQSNIAARLNGYLVGFGGVEQFDKEAHKLGLSEPDLQYVRSYIIKNEGNGMSCGTG